MKDRFFNLKHWVRAKRINIRNPDYDFCKSRRYTAYVAKPIPKEYERKPGDI